MKTEEIINKNMQWRLCDCHWTKDIAYVKPTTMKRAKSGG